MDTPKFLILSGDGINCENETAFAFKSANAEAEIIHINDLLDNPEKIHEFDGMALPGGFSFGDELGSGKIMALKIKHGLSNEFSKFVADMKPIIGICNGFQVLTKLGLLPEAKLNDRKMALAQNASGGFINKWARMNVNKTLCKWTLLSEDIIDLPIRHGEGRVVFKEGEEDSIYQNLKNNNQIVFEYLNDENGSFKNIAGICDPSGLILGMMPHPEASLYDVTSPIHGKFPFEKADGIKLFESIITYLKNK